MIAAARLGNVDVGPAQTLRPEVMNAYATLVGKALRPFILFTGQVRVLDQVEEVDSVVVDYLFPKFSGGANGRGFPWVEAWDLIPLVARMQKIGFKPASFQIEKSRLVLSFVKKAPRSEYA